MKGSTLVGMYFDEAKNDDSFYLPPIAARLGRWFWWPINTFRTNRSEAQ